MSEPDETVDERFFRALDRADYGAEAVTQSIRYLGRGRGIFTSGIYILEFHWTDEAGSKHMTTRQEINDVYGRLKRALAVWKDRNKDVRPLLFYRFSGSADPTCRQAQICCEEYSARLRGLVSHLQQACADIAYLERQSDTSITWTPHHVSHPIAYTRYDPLLALRGGTTYPFLLARTAQAFLGMDPPLELDMVRIMARISRDIKVPTFGMRDARKTKDEAESKRMVAACRIQLRDILERKAQEGQDQPPAYMVQLPSYQEATQQ